MLVQRFQVKQQGKGLGFSFRALTMFSKSRPNMSKDDLHTPVTCISLYWNHNAICLDTHRFVEK